MFIPLLKADAAQRLVYGSFDETPDRAGEICDYATAKPAFQAWSDQLSKASDGKSLGNIRGQHSNIAAGKLIELTFDDMGKSIGFVAQIVDDNEWRKVEEGVYTGFSPGGRYAKRWQDGSHKRYTPDVRELSIVDVPCNPAATFTMVKADGAEEQRGFTVDKAYEPGNEATVERADVLAKAAGKVDRRNDFVAKARAELIAENADAALAKMADEPEAKLDPAAALEAALAKGAKLGGGGDAQVVAVNDLAGRGAAMRLLAKSVDGQPLLAKGMYTLERVGCLLERAGEIASSVSWEEKAENDTDSKLPQMAVALVGSIKDFLIEMANEETAELLTSIQANMPEFDLVVVSDDDDDVDTLALATSIVDLVKADADLMEKAGKRNSSKDQGMIQTMHDHSVKLGAECAFEKDAVAALTADNERLSKALSDAAPKVEGLVDRMEKMEAAREADREAMAKATSELTAANARIAELEARPELAKGVLIVHEKTGDGSTAPAGPSALDQIAALPPGPAKQAAILASVGQSRR